MIRRVQRSYLRGGWDAAARLYGQGFRQFVVAGLVPAVLVPIISRWAFDRGLAISIAVGVAAFSVTLVAPAAMMVLAAAQLHGTTVSVARAYLAALRRLVSIVAAAVIVALVVIVPLGIAVTILTASGLRAAPLLVATVVCGFLLTLRFQLALPAIVFARIGPWRAIGRSWMLLRGSTVAFIPLALAAFLAELAPNVSAGFLDAGVAYAAVGACIVLLALPVSAVALTVAYDRLLERQRATSLGWIPEDEVAAFAATAARRESASTDEGGSRRIGWRHLLLLPTIASVVGLAIGAEWGGLLFLLGLPCLLALGLWAAIARLLAADY